MRVVRKVTIVVGVLIVGLLMASAAQAALISAHTGSNDPTTEGFSLAGGAALSAGADPGPPANWAMNPNGLVGYYSDPSITTADFDDPTGWTLTVREKVSGIGPLYYAGVWVADGHSRIVLAPGDTSDTMNILNVNTSALTPIGTGKATEWHTWQLYMAPGANPSLDVAELYQDGVLVGTVGRSAFGGTFAEDDLLFGALSSPGGPLRVQYYATVSLETGKHIPEPSTLMLLATGLLGLLAYAWRKRR